MSVNTVYSIKAECVLCSFSLPGNATVVFVEYDASMTLTGQRRECLWRGMTGMMCSDTVVLYVSRLDFVETGMEDPSSACPHAPLPLPPPLPRTHTPHTPPVRAVLNVHCPLCPLPPVPVAVTRCLSPPSSGRGLVFDIALSVGGVPTTFTGGRWTYGAPVVTGITPSLLPPEGAVQLLIWGLNFGSVAGIVAVGSRVLACSSWLDDHLVCTAPPGASASIPLVGDKGGACLLLHASPML
jgi:hypothetical protein